MTAAELFVDDVRAEHVQIGRVRDQHELLLRDAAAAKLLERALAADDDPLGTGVELPLEPLGAAHGGPARQRPERDRDGRPEVADLEDERHALHPGGREPRDPDRERRRRGEHDVRLALERPCDGRGDRERGERREPHRLGIPVRVRNVEVEDVDAVDRLASQEAALRLLVAARLEPPGVAAHDRDPVTALDEPPRELVRARRGRAPAGGEVLVEVENVQAEAG